MRFSKLILSRFVPFAALAVALWGPIGAQTGWPPVARGSRCRWRQRSTFPPKRRRPGQGKGASEPAAGPGNEACAPPKCLSPDEGRPPILAAAGARGADNTLTTPGEVRFGAGRPTGPLQLLAYTAPRRSPVMASMSSRSMSACPAMLGRFLSPGSAQIAETQRFRARRRGSRRC
jgi:hypothetical protein